MSKGSLRFAVCVSIVLAAACAHAPARPALAPADRADAAAVTMTLGPAQTPVTLVDISGQWNGVSLPPNTVVLPGTTDGMGNFSQTSQDVVCDAAAPTQWCQATAPKWTIIISGTKLVVSGGNVAGSLQWTMIAGPVVLNTTVQLTGNLSGGVYNVAQVGAPGWNMQLRAGSAGAAR